jgi:hypothetical protein
MSAAAIDRERLTKLLGMMGSQHDGEALAAARQAERLRAEAGLTWAEIVIPRLPAPPQRQSVGTVADAIAFLLARRSALTQWEVGFVESVWGARYSLSSKQIEVLHRLVEKARRAEARAA